MFKTVNFTGLHELTTGFIATSVVPGTCAVMMDVQVARSSTAFCRPRQQLRYPNSWAKHWPEGMAIMSTTERGVFRIGPNLTPPMDPRDVFAPSNWKQLDDDDLDLGGVTPLPLTLPGSGIRLLLALGKDGKAYLLDRASLGGLGGALSVRPAARGAIITSAAAWPVHDAVFVAYQARAVSCPNDLRVFAARSRRGSSVGRNTVGFGEALWRFRSGGRV